MYMNKIIGLLFCFLTLFHLNAQTIDLTEKEQREIYEIVESVVKKKNLVGISFAVTYKDKILYKDAIGYQEKSTKAKASTQTAFAIGSITKLLTVTAIMQLVEQEKINLNESIEKYIPEFSIKTRFSGKEKDYSIRNLMTHHSGLPSDYLKGLISKEVWTIDALIDALKFDYQPVPSNTISTYSNVAFSLLGKVIENVSGLTYEDYIHQYIFEPLEMRHSAFRDDHPNVKGRLSKGYSKKEELNRYPMRDVAAGACVTSVEDMSNFMQMYLNNGSYKGKQILKPSSIKALWKHQNENIALDFDFEIGLTWRLGNNQGVSNFVQSTPIKMHTGSTVLFCNILMLAPEKDIGVVVMENTARMNNTTNNIGNDIMKYLLETKFGLKKPNSFLPERQKGIEDIDFDRLPGSYATEFGLINIDKRGKRLHADLLGRKFKMIPHENNTFGIKFRLLGFIPIGIGALSDIRLSHEKVENKEVLVFNDHSGGKMFFGTKFHPTDFDGNWKRRIGKYEVINLEKDYQIVHDMEIKEYNGILYMQFIPKLYEKFPIRMPLKVLNDKQAIVEGYARWQGETVYFEELEEHGIVFKHLGYFYKKVKKNE